MILLATNKIDFKRGWSDRSLKAFQEGKDNVCLMYFSVGLIESGFKKHGEYAGVERWYLADTDIYLLVNTNNATWGFDNQCPTAIPPISIERLIRPPITNTKHLTLSLVVELHIDQN